MADYVDIAHKKHLHKGQYYGSKIVYTQGTDDFGKNATVMLEICEGCGYIEFPQCEHENRRWVKNDTRLDCDFCHADLT